MNKERLSNVYIVSSAVRRSNEIVSGIRHGECIQRAITILGWKPPYGDIEQGFIDQMGVFYGREQALNIVSHNGQLNGDILGGELTSEDLW